jgi:hypothetical protein
MVTVGIFVTAKHVFTEYKQDVQQIHKFIYNANDMLVLAKCELIWNSEVKYFNRDCALYTTHKVLTKCKNS